MRRVILTLALLIALVGVAAQVPLRQVPLLQTASIISFNFGGTTAALTAISNSAERWKLDPAMMYAICMIESGCGRNTEAANSSASGIYQYLDSTWRQECGAYKAHVNSSASCNVNDAQMAAEVFAYQRKQAEAQVSSIAQASGLPAGLVHYIDHFLPAMAKKLPNKELYNQSFAALFGSAAATGNNLQGKTFAQAIEKFNREFARFAGSVPANLANLATGQDTAPSLVTYSNQWWSSPWGQQVSQYQTPTQQSAFRQSYQQPSYQQPSYSQPSTAANTIASPYATQQGGAQSQAIRDMLNNAGLVGDSSPADAPIVTSTDESDDASVDTTDAGGVTTKPLARVEYDGRYLIWATLGTTACTITGPGVNGTGTAGHVYVGTIETGTEYTLKCSSPVGDVVYRKEI